MLNIEEIKEREQVATKGPWVVRENKSFGIQSENKNIASCFRRENENFIAHARQDIPDLIAEVERLQDLLAERNVLLDKQDVELAESRRRERAAIRDLEEIATGADVCGYCKNTGEQCKLCGVPVQDDTSPSNFEWRGPQEGRNERNGKV